MFNTGKNRTDIKQKNDKRIKQERTRKWKMTKSNKRYNDENLL